MRIFVRFSFFGRNFHGTQKQPSSLTVQGLFEDVLSSLYDEKVKVTISSRLDKDVNALDFAIVFDREKETVSLSHLEYYLRRMVGKDIKIKDVSYVRDDFSPRYDCASKTYLYLIQNTENRVPLYNSITYSPDHPLDEVKMRECMALFRGRHDFRYLSSPEGEENTILDIDECTMEKKDEILYIRFTGKAFLRYQIRFMVGAMIRYATGKVTLDTLKSMLDGHDEKYQKLKAEPQALTLEHIDYPELEDRKIHMSIDL